MASDNVYWGCFHLLINYLSSVSVVVVNKLLYTKYGFHYGAILSLIHFIFTFLGILFLGLTAYFEIKRVQFKSLIWLSIVYSLSVPFCSLSICHNSLGFYQISKTLIIPFTILLERIWYKEKIHLNAIYYVVPILMGSYITADTDLNLNIIGLFFSLSCVIASGISQKWIQLKQKDMNLNSLQIMIYLMPLSIITQTISAPILDDIAGKEGIIKYKFTIETVMIILFSAFLAMIVNISLFMTLRNVSPLTFQIVGQLKSVTVIMTSLFLFRQNQNLSNIFGMSLTLIGVFIYIYIKYSSNQNK